MRLARFRFGDRIAHGAVEDGSDLVRVLRGTFFEDPLPTGEEVTLETRDANDLQIHAGTATKALERIERTVTHPLTGRVYIKGAEPGDLLEIEYLDIVPERYGWTRFAPGGGIPPDLLDYYQ